jgi:hypothetical protein
MSRRFRKFPFVSKLGNQLLERLRDTTGNTIRANSGFESHPFRVGFNYFVISLPMMRSQDSIGFTSHSFHAKDFS